MKLILNNSYVEEKGNKTDTKGLKRQMSRQVFAIKPAHKTPEPVPEDQDEGKDEEEEEDEEEQQEEEEEENEDDQEDEGMVTLKFLNFETLAVLENCTRPFVFTSGRFDRTSRFLGC